MPTPTPTPFSSPPPARGGARAEADLRPSPPAAGEDEGTGGPRIEDLPLLDAGRVALLRADGGWPEIVQAFAEYAPDAIAEIEAALGAGTKEALYAAAHKLKGCCANLGLLRLAAHAAALEAAAERPAGRLGPRLAGDLRQVAAASVRALEAG